MGGSGKEGREGGRAEGDREVGEGSKEEGRNPGRKGGGEKEGDRERERR